MAFCYSVGGVPAEQFIHERVSNRPGRQRWTERMEHPSRVAVTGNKSVLAQIGLTISISSRRQLASGFTSHRVVSSWERPAQIDRITLIEAGYLWEFRHRRPGRGRWTGRCWD
jgi:hypothetical protein